MLALLLLLGQWLDHPAKNIPRTKDGRPVLTAKAPKTREGRPDLSGIWLPDNTAGVKGTNGEPLPGYFISVTFGQKDEDVPLTEAGAAAFRRNLADNEKGDPTSYCKPIGVPSVDTLPIPFKIVQTPGLIVVLYEGDTSYRQIFTDGRTHAETTIPSWMGYSVGRWEGDTLVVETTGFNDKSWLDRIGHTHSDEMKVTEKFHRRDLGHMDVAITIADPKTFTRPIGYTQSVTLTPDSDLLEYFCTDNEVDSAHFK
ncbi:MAG TPA: hypothetical protein VN628_08915 [Vicinamibacterales bacterium]|nr:hypothetical protein [Vicinamibacterales bacterium]